MFILKISDIQFINKETLYSIILIGYSVFLFYLGVPGRPQLTFLGYPASKRRANTVLLNIFVNNHGNILINGESFSLLLFIMLCFGAYLLLLSSVAVKFDVLCFIYAPSMPSMNSLLFL